jgi:hypothetical protein
MNHKRPTTGTRKRKRIKLDMRNGACPLGGYPTVITAMPIYYKSGDLAYYIVSEYSYNKHIANDNLVCGTSNGIAVVCHK